MSSGNKYCAEKKQSRMGSVDGSSHFTYCSWGSQPGDLKKGWMSHIRICWKNVSGRRKSKGKCPAAGVCSRDSKEASVSRRLVDTSKEVGRRRSYRALGAVICLWLLLWVGWKSIESHKKKSDLILFSCEGISLDAIRITVKVPKWRSTVVIS